MTHVQLCDRQQVSMKIGIVRASYSILSIIIIDLKWFIYCIHCKIGTLTIKATMKTSYKVVTPGFLRFRLAPSISKLQVAIVEVNVVAGTIRDPTLVPGRSGSLRPAEREDVATPTGLQRLVLRHKILKPQLRFTYLSLFLYVLTLNLYCLVL